MATTTTRNSRKETVHINYPVNFYGDTDEDSEIYAVNMIDALNRAREMVMFVSEMVIIAVTTTHNVWEISIHKTTSPVFPFEYFANDMELDRHYRLIPSHNENQPTSWTIQPA